MSGPSLLYQVPNPQRSTGNVWVTRCAECNVEIHMGPGSKAAMVRLIEAVGRYCGTCRSGLSGQVPTEEPR